MPTHSTKRSAPAPASAASSKRKKVSKPIRKPALRAAPKGKPAKKSMSQAQKLQMMSPFGKSYPPPSNSLGNFLCLNDLGRGSLTTSTNQKILCVFAPSVGGTYSFVAWNADGTFVSGSELTGPLYKYRTGEAPVVYKPFRAGIRAVNTSATDDVAGSLQVLNNSSPIELVYSGTGVNITTDCITSLINLVQDSHKTKTFSAHELKSSHTWINFPATRSDYEKYRAFDKGITAAEFNSQYRAAETDMPMSTLMLLFSNTASANGYEIETCIQHASRFTSNLLQGLQKPAPSSSPAQDTQMADVHAATVQNGAGAIMSPM
jgi:hypothetical protein